VIKEIRTDEDIEGCVRVIRKAFKTVADEFGLTERTAPTNPAFITFGKLKQSLNQGTHLFGLVKNKQVIGCIAVERSDKDKRIFFIERLAVLPKARHRGQGTELMDFACSYIKSRGGKTVSIGIINENIILKTWYMAYGFKEISTKRFEHLPFTVCFLEKSI
jgi:ribosomal protein S18 acetylase RimI-like enzyme